MLLIFKRKSLEHDEFLTSRRESFAVRYFVVVGNWYRLLSFFLQNNRDRDAKYLIAGCAVI